MLWRLGLKRLVLAGLLAFTPAWATDYYVRTDGNDSNLGTTNTAGGAFRTLGKCSTTLVAGDRCLIQPGTYRERGVVQSNAGSLKTNNLRSDCTCTNGSTTIACGGPVTGVLAGEFVQCDSGFGFSWTEVQSVSGSSITLVEGYRGATSTTSGADTLDAARFIQFIGQGSTPRDAMITTWYDEPVDVGWTLEGGTSCVYSYAKSGTADTNWQAPQGIRDNNPNWDLNRLNHNGKDAYLYLEGSTTGDNDGNGAVQTCPCGNTVSQVTAIEDMPGSWGQDATKVYAHTRHTCVGGAYAGVSCLGNSDCPGSTCGACSDPDSLDMEVTSSVRGVTLIFTSNKDYTVVKNLAFDAGNRPFGGPGKSDTYAVRFGGNNSLYTNVTTDGGVFNIYPQIGGSVTSDTRYEHLDILDSTICNTVAGGYSGLAFYDVEVRGNYGNLLSCDEFRGASDQDRIILDRLFLHRNFTDYIGSRSGGSCNGNSVTWNCSTKYWDTSTTGIQYRGNHLMYMGSTAIDRNMDHILVQNSVGEIATDGFGVFNGNNTQDVWFVNNTFGTTGNRPHRLKAKFGITASTSGGAKSYNNLFLYEYPTAISEGPIDGEAGVARATEVQSDYNLFYNLGIDANPGQSTPLSMRVWESGETLSSVITTYGQELHSTLLCGSKCAGATPGTHVNAGTTHRLTDISVSDGDGTDYTPTTGNWGINTGTNLYCPREDFYGNPRNDGQCDIGAVEVQSQSANPTVTTTTGNWADGQTVTIIGTNFGTKTVPAPLVWDDATGSNILTNWRQVLPNAISEAPSENTNYRTAPFNGISGPHARAPKFIGGLHKRTGFYTGDNVVLEKQFTPGSGWLYVYFWTMRDPTFKFCGSPGVSGCSVIPDDNWKDGWYDQTAETYTGSGWHIEADPKATSCSSTGNWQWHIYDNADVCNAECNTVSGDDSTYGGTRGTPCDWRLVEWRYKLVPSATADAFQVFENGVRQMNVTGYTDATFTGSSRYISIGGFSRAVSDTNWRYFADVYVDTTPARVLLCRNPTISATDHGVCYPQIPTAWSDTSITVTVNQAEFQGGTTAYLYVYNGSELVSTTGTPIVLSATDTNTNTKIRGNVRIVGSGTKVK